MNGLSLGVNWFLNVNTTVNTEWVYDNVTSNTSAPFRFPTAGRAASALACSCRSNTRV